MIIIKIIIRHFISLEAVKIYKKIIRKKRKTTTTAEDCKRYFNKIIVSRKNFYKN